MSNPINNDLGVNRIQGRAGARVNEESRGEATKGRERTGNSPGDRVTLTEDARRIGEVLSQALDSSDVDSARVETLREAVSSGAYEVDAQRVAEKLVAFESAISGADEE